MESRKRKHDDDNESTTNKLQKIDDNKDGDLLDEKTLTPLLAGLRKNNDLSYDAISDLLKKLAFALQKKHPETVHGLLIDTANLVCERLTVLMSQESFNINEEKEEGEIIHPQNDLTWLLYNVGNVASHGVVLSESFLAHIPSMLTQLKNHSAPLHNLSLGLHGISMIIIHSTIKNLIIKNEVINAFFNMNFNQCVGITCIVRAAANISPHLETQFSTILLEKLTVNYIKKRSPEDNKKNYLIIEGIGRFAKKLDAPIDSYLLNCLLTGLEKSSSNFQVLPPKEFTITARSLYFLSKEKKIKGDIETIHLNHFLTAFRGDYKNIIYIAQLIRRYDPDLNVLKTIDLILLSTKIKNSLNGRYPTPAESAQLINALTLFKDYSVLFREIFTNAFKALTLPFNDLSADIQQELIHYTAGLKIDSDWRKELNQYVNLPTPNKFDTQAQPTLIARLEHGRRSYPSIDWNIGILPCAENGIPGKKASDIFKDYILYVIEERMPMYSQLLLPIHLNNDHYAGLSIKMHAGQISIMAFYNSLHNEEQDDALIKKIKDGFLNNQLISEDIIISYEKRCMQQTRKEDCFTLLIENFYCGIRNQWWPQGTPIKEIQNKHMVCLMPHRPVYSLGPSSGPITNSSAQTARPQQRM